MIVNEVLSAGLDEGVNMVIPKVGGSVSSIEKVIGVLKDEGYEVSVVNVQVSADEAMSRMYARFIKTGRLVNPQYARMIGDSPAETYRTIKEKGGADAFAEIDNNTGIGEPKDITEDTAGILGGSEVRGAGARRPDGGSPQTVEGQGQVEATPEGEQLLIDGVRPITDADRARVEADKPMTGGNAAVDFGLFDITGRSQGDLLDLTVPVGETIDADGKRVAATSTVRAVLDDLEADQEFVEQLQLCDTAGGTT